MSKIKMQKRSLWNFVVFSLMLTLIVGCSAFHKVAVISYGDEDAGVEEAVSEKGNVTASAPPVRKPVPMTPPLPVTPSANGSIGEEIFSQSAEDTTLPWTLQDVFFDYDRMSIRRDAIPILEQNATVLLRRYANREVLIQGHCDERGTEAYNIILGERRATAVKNYLVNLGVADSQLRVLSLGKSQPFCQERTIFCFRQNRRAHFVVK